MVGPKLSGDKVNLRPLTTEDVRRRYEWLSDHEVFRLFTGSLPSKPYAVSDVEIWRCGLESDPTAIVWAIETKQDRHIGDVDLHGIDHSSRAAKLTILVGEKAFWNHGYGTDTVRTVLDYAFTETQISQVDLRVFEFNVRGIGCYRKCGFLTTWVPARDQDGVTGPPEIHMSVTKEHFLAEYRNSATARS